MKSQDNNNRQYGIAAYGSVVNGSFSVNDMQAIQNTKAYQRLLDIQKIYSKGKYNIKDIKIMFDVLGGVYRKRKALNEILDEASNVAVVIIDSLSALGTKNEELIHNYKLLFKKKIGLVVQREKQFSTAKFDIYQNTFYPTVTSDTDIERLCSELVNFEYQTNRGKKKLEISKEFVILYWLYENYFIDTIIYKNKLLTISKLGFAKLCDAYEKTDDYKEILKIQKEKNEIAAKPKRIGSVDESVFEQIYNLVNSGSTLPEACEAVSIDALSDIEYERYYLKYSGKKSATLKASFEYKDDTLISLLKVEDNTSLDVLNRVIRDALGVDFMLSEK